MMYEKLSVKDLWKYCHVWPDDNPYDVHKLVAEAAEAIEKLQSELEQVKAERDTFLKGKAEREKGCEFCNKNFQHNYNWLIRDYMLNDKERPRIEITGDGIAVIECDYCPKCGRKLVSEE